MFNNSRSISVTQKIDSSALELWKIISKPGNLNLTHPFCKINDIIKCKNLPDIIQLPLNIVDTNLLNSKILTPLNKIWFKFGILLGGFISPIVMGIVFFTIVTPTSLIMKVLGKNLLNLKKGNKKTYWIEKSKIESKMKNQF